MRVFLLNVIEDGLLLALLGGKVFLVRFAEKRLNYVLPSSGTFHAPVRTGYCLYGTTKLLLLLLKDLQLQASLTD